MADGAQVLATDGIAVNLHRVDGAVAAHLINYGYDHERDAVAMIAALDLAVRLPGEVATGTVVRPGRSPEPLELDRDGDRYRVRLGEVGPYTVVVFR